MKYIEKNYTFDASAQTITFDSWTSIDIRQILLITNLTKQTIIYDFSVVGLGGTTAANVLTLTYNTTLQDDTDQLQIFLSTELETRVDETTNATYTYVGKAVPGTPTASAYWQVFRFETSGNINLEYADNNDAFDNVWDNRDSLTYT